VLGIDNSVLLSYYQSRTGATAGTAASGGGSTSTATKYAPTAPWSTSSTAPKSAALVQQALQGHPIIDENAAKLDLPGASEDYKKLFTLYQGINTLYGLAAKANTTSLSALDKLQLNQAFKTGLASVVSYADTQQFAQLRMTRGDAMTTDKSSVGVPKDQYAITGRTVLSGGTGDEVPAFQGQVAFDISIKKVNSSLDVPIDLNGMGSTPRTVPNVVSYINDQLAAAGVATRFATNRTPGAPTTVQAGGKTITLPAGADTWGIQVNGVLGENLTLSDANAGPAVYVTTRSGNPDPDKNTATKDAVYQSAMVKVDGSGAVGAPGSRIFTSNFEGTVDQVRASQVGADGSVYMLADVTGAVSGQTLKGPQDVALLKYDSSGALLYARTLGAAASATGLGLAVADDGRVAVSGSVTGALGGAADGALNSPGDSGLSDSFVSLYNAAGDETWTQRRGALGADEASSVAFGADGVVYVAGRTKGAMPGASAVGGWDSYVSAIGTSSQGAPQTLFTQQFGTTGDDKVTGLAVNGNQLVVAGVENGAGVLRSFDLANSLTTTKRDMDANGAWTNTVTTTTGGVVTGTTTTSGTQPASGAASSKTTTATTGASATAGAVRNLGDLGGGSLVGLTIQNGSIWVGGDTTNGALAISGQTLAGGGGRDAFAARLSTDLSSQGQDAVAFFGGAGTETVTGMAVSGGKAYLVGQASDDTPAGDKIGTKDSYLAELDVASGAVINAQRITGKDGYAAATTVAVGATGAGALDKLGLPTGTIDFSRSTSIVSASSARAGDTFQIRTSVGGPLSTVTLEANDTLDTLAKKVQRAAGFHANVQVLSNGDSKVLQIGPQNQTDTVEILAGKGGANLLDALGLKQGVVRNTTVNKDGTVVSADGKGKVYGLGLPNTLDISSPAAIKATLATLSSTLSQIRTAYADLQTAASPKPLPTAAAGSVPAYLTNQISNYQAALDRLGGGQSSGSTGIASLFGVSG
jgi:hypothetical protein